MTRFKFVVLSNAKAGREAEYQDWYAKRHLADVLAVPGFVSAQCFKLKDGMGFPHRHQYLALYEIESDEPLSVIGEMIRRRDTMVMSDAQDSDSVTCGVFEVCSPEVKAKTHEPTGKAKLGQGT
jgi:hypothetical protein